MPVDVRWLDDSRTTLIQLPHDNWTWEEFYETTDEAFAMLEESNGKVDVIIDWSQTQNWPLNTTVHGRKLLSRQHPKQGIMVFAGMNAVLSGIFSVFMQMNRAALKDRTVLTAKTVDAALLLLGERRQSA
jgi:hypothetical protein